MNGWILLLTTFLGGCVSQVARIDVPEIERSASLIVKDLRPEAEKQNKIFSLSITNDAYAIYRRGDAMLDPSATRIFQHKVYEKFQSTLPSPDLIIHHFVVYWNAQSELRRSSIGAAFGGVLGSAIASDTQNNSVDNSKTLVDRNSFESVEKDEYKRALYTDVENPNKASVYIVYLDAEINGKRSFVKSVSPSKLESNKNPMAFAVESAIEYFLQQY